MRFQDWDVLIFPHASAVPIQEFRTECFAVESEIGVTPTLNSFVASSPRGAPFQISVHSWTTPRFSPELIGTVLPRGCHKAWAARVMVDGVVVASETFVQGVRWPQVIGINRNLKFPNFRRSILGQSRLHIADDKGRIKVMLCEGLLHPGQQPSFEPRKNIACFAFVHAPLVLLQNCNIAWPNPHILETLNREQAASRQPYGQAQPSLNTSMHFPGYRQNQGSQDSGFYSIPSAAMPPPPVPGLMFANMDYRGGFGQSSDYCLSNETGGPVVNPLQSPFMPDTKPQLQVRLPSDQIQQIVNAFSAGVQEAAAAERGVQTADTTVPNNFFDIEGFMQHGSGPRKTSITSDISMHLSCTQFPDCLVDGPDGSGLVHNPHPATAPVANMIRSRKRSRADNDVTDSTTSRKVSKTEKTAQVATDEDATKCGIS